MIATKRHGTRSAPRHETADQTLLGQLLHDEINRLPTAAAHFHASTSDVTGSGILDVQRCSSWHGRAIARLLRLPHASGPTPVTLTIRRECAGTSQMTEHWCRRFGEEAMDSTQTSSAGNVIERIGRIELRFAASIDGGRLCFDHVATSIRIGTRVVPLPRTLAPHIRASVGGDHERLDVSVRIDAPLVGTLLAYTGELTQEAAP